MNFDSFFFRSPPAWSSFLVSLLSLSLSLARALARFLSLLLLQQQQQQERQRARRDSRCGEHQGKEREREKQRERERETWGMPKTRRCPFFSLRSSPAATQLVEEKPPLLPPPVASSPILRPTPLPFFPFPKQPRQQTNGASIHVPCGADLLWRETTLSANPFLSSPAPSPLSAGPRPPSPPVPFLASR